MAKNSDASPGGHHGRDPPTGPVAGPDRRIKRVNLVWDLTRDMDMEIGEIEEVPPPPQDEADPED